MMDMDTSDEILAQAAAGGDAQAFAQLAERCYDRTFALAFRLTGARDQAQDLTQDVLCALPRKLAGYRGEARFTTWLYRVTVNAAHDRRRRTARHDRAGAEWGEVEHLRRADADQARDEAAWLTDAMARLPADLRDTLALTVTKGVTQAQAAQVLDV
jgi:RNA polymerase sigma-70 factor (ECF subfamily)